MSAFNAPRSYVQIQQARAAEAGVLAARFAAAGAPGKENILEEDFVGAYADDYQLDGITRDLGVDFMLPQTYLVMHYGCRHLHAPVDATVQIVKEQGLAPGDIAEIRVNTYRVAIELANEEPKSAEEAGFSNGFAIAVALLYGDAFQDRFSEAYLAEPKVRDLMSRVKVAHDPELDKEFPGKRAAVVTLLTRDGREFQHRLDLARGEPEIPFSAAEIEAKFQHVARGVVSPDTARRIIDYVNQIEQAPDISPLLALLQAETTA